MKNSTRIDKFPINSSTFGSHLLQQAQSVSILQQRENGDIYFPNTALLFCNVSSLCVNKVSPCHLVEAKEHREVFEETRHQRHFLQAHPW